jgi:FHA domain/Protein of unknown function (DUF3662)
MNVTTPPTGLKIVRELVREMEDRLYPLFYRTLAPPEYHVYLHADDYRELEAIVPLIVADAQRQLNDRVDELNKRPRWAVFDDKSPIELPPGGWAIFFRPDANGEIAPGELGIVSRLSVPVSLRYDGGAPTVRIGRTVVTGTVRRTAVAEEAAGSPARPAQSDTEPSSTRPGPGTREQTRPLEPAMAPGLASLAYVDDDGPHVVVMRKDLISIGRGGSAHWVDVQVAADAHVSREHCRIRHDAGRFFLQDVSTGGTSVSGSKPAPFLRTNNGRVEETGQEHELPRRARIELAGALVIEFDAETVR